MFTNLLVQVQDLVESLVLEERLKSLSGVVHEQVLEGGGSSGVLEPWHVGQDEREGRPAGASQRSEEVLLLHQSQRVGCTFDPIIVRDLSATARTYKTRFIN